MFVDRYIPLGPALSVLLLGAALAIVVTDRRISAIQDRAALRQHDAIKFGYEAGRKAAA